MITGSEGGFVHRAMPPVDWDCGPIPEACYDATLGPAEIEALLTPVYLDARRVRRLTDSEDPIELLQAKVALEILVDIDARTIWGYNQMRAPAGKEAQHGDHAGGA